jgi:hypothetical protein
MCIVSRHTRHIAMRTSLECKHHHVHRDDWWLSITKMMHAYFFLFFASTLVPYHTIHPSISVRPTSSQGISSTASDFRRFKSGLNNKTRTNLDIKGQKRPCLSPHGFDDQQHHSQQFSSIGYWTFPSTQKVLDALGKTFFTINR